MMKLSLLRSLGAGIASALYMIMPTPGHADDWGCQVLLCLSNPGSPTEYAECVPPITKLWKHLAKGRSFPTCSGVDFSATKPRYEPYECGEGYKLTYFTSGSDHGDSRRAACVATQITKLDRRECSRNHERAPSGQMVFIDGEMICGRYDVTAAKRRENPRYVDVTIQDRSTQRVWF